MKPQPPSKPTVDRRFAKDVAVQLDRRRMRRRVLLWLLLIGAIVLAVMYGTCGSGFGLGGKGAGKGAGSGTTTPAGLLAPVDGPPRPCEVRIAASGITVDGKPATVVEAVAACRPARAAHVVTTGGARQSDWDELKGAFDAAEIRISRDEVREGSGSGSAGSAAPP